ncbi:MAG: DUF1732 domain-containing protein [Candidatus Dependentiae bacterium]|nr:DUF1732 domain-containing protein [Candidatus Dependentiae bacterium]
MALSMTGFAARTCELPVGERTVTHPTMSRPSQTATVTIQLKSLNARFFEASCKMPFVFSSLETAIIKRLRERLIRGTVYCTIFLNSPAPFASKPQATFTVVEGYLDAAEEVEKRFGERANISPDLSIASILTLPNVIEFREAAPDVATTEQLLAEIDKTIDLLVAERTREGASLAADLTRGLETIVRAVAAVKSRAATVMAEKRAALIAELKKFVAQAAVEEKEHYFQLIYTQLEKLDIHEEIVRLETHATNAMAIVASPAVEQGKRLDFTLQEMSREANTIGAKCADAELGTSAITIKVELEKLREQAQNII